MQAAPIRPVSGHVFRLKRKRGDRWYMKYRLPDGRQVQKLIGPAWTSRKGAPPPGHYTKRTAQAFLDETLARARRRGFEDDPLVQSVIQVRGNRVPGYVPNSTDRA
jgi:hypothetical protein